MHFGSFSLFWQYCLSFISSYKKRSVLKKANKKFKLFLIIYQFIWLTGTSNDPQGTQLMLGLLTSEDRRSWSYLLSYTACRWAVQGRSLWSAGLILTKVSSCLLLCTCTSYNIVSYNIFILFHNINVLLCIIIMLFHNNIILFHNMFFLYSWYMYEFSSSFL